MLGAHSDTLLLAHVVWATSNRTASLGEDFDAWHAGFAAHACARVGCDLLAVGNASDHVHVVVRVSAAVALAELVRRLKGASSHAWNVAHRGRPLRWQEGYWARSIDQQALEPLTVYVRDQRSRHAAATALAAWEQNEATQVVATCCAELA
jgi:putative transposase